MTADDKMALLTSLVFLTWSVIGATAVYPFRNPKLPFHERVDDLVSRLTIEEIANQSITLYGNPTFAAVPRLGIKPYVYITECIRGQYDTNTTAFPHSIGLSASWSEELLFNMSTAISTEVRGQWNSYTKRGIYKTYVGLTCFSPVINIARHPLWGRNQETYGECPYLSGSLVQDFVRGLQGSDDRYLKVGSGCKHFDVYGGPENIPVSRLSFDAKVSTTDYRMTFLPAFKMCVDAGTHAIGCSYNSINGVPACLDRTMMVDIARKEWGFKGYVFSDDGAIAFAKNYFHFNKTDEEISTTAIKAGCNLELGSTLYQKQVNASKMGLITEEELRENVKPLLYTRMRLGEFDPPSMNPYSSINMSVVQSAEHRALAVKAAQMSFTLLKNDGNALPLKGTVPKLAIVGPFGNVTDQLFGEYSSNAVPQFTTTVLQGLSKLATDKVSFASGCDNTVCAHYDASVVKTAVTGSNLIIVALGTGQAVEAEGHDRAYLDLPGRQLDLLKDAVYYADAETTVILLLFNAGPLDITWAKLHPRVSAILACYLPAQSTGKALYNTLMATSPDAVPAGRLTMTWPADLSQVAPITDYTMEGRTYRYYNGDPLYPFGYGLSYSKFQYSGLSVNPQSVEPGQSVTVTVIVENIGNCDADEVIQVYMSWPLSVISAPKLQLVGFARERLVKGQSITKSFTIVGEQMRVWISDSTGWGYPIGEMKLYAGGQQPNQRTAVPSNVLTTSFQMIL